MTTTRPKISFTKFQSARAIVARDAPYLQTLLYTVRPKVVSPEVMGRVTGSDKPAHTFAITDTGVLLMTQEALDAWSEKEVAAVIEHELWHLLSEHSQRTGGRDIGLANVAKDIAINGMLQKGGRQLPKTECTPEAWGFPSGLTWEDYYERLLKHPKVQGAQSLGQGQGSDPFGRCGSGAGNPLPNEPKEPGDPNKKVDGQGQGRGNGQGDGSGDDGPSQDDIAHARRQCASDLAQEAARDGGRGIGHVPGGMLRAIEELLKPPKVPWHARLARLLRKGTSTAPGMVDYRYDRFTRRMAALSVSGVRPPLMPRMVSPEPKVLVGIDTSGSMGDGALAEAMSEVEGIFRAAKGRISYLSCDTQVNSSGKAATWKDVASKLKGGGGTLIAPIFEHVKEMKADARPNLMVVFTDGGFSDCPEFPPHGVSVIWVLVGDYKMRGTTKFGEVVEVDDKEDA